MDGACPPQVCDVQIELEAATCGRSVELVEVLVNGKLEPGLWRPGQRLRTCATVARGAAATLDARSDGSWRWQHEVSCPPLQQGEAAGYTIVRVLHCKSVP